MNMTGQLDLSNKINLAIEDTDKVMAKAKEFGESLLSDVHDYEEGTDMDKTVVKGIEAYLGTFQSLMYQRAYVKTPEGINTISLP